MIKQLTFIISALMTIQIACSIPAQAQSSTREESYLAIAQLPDFDGLWEPLPDPTFGAGSQIIMTPEYASHAEAYRKAEARGDIQDSPAANCVPMGMPIAMRDPYPFEILITPGKVTLIIEAHSQWRQIFTDGRALPEDPDPSFNGHSIGQWEGDTLIVESIGFDTATAMGRSFGERHSDQMRIVERMRLTDEDTLEIETIVYDSEALLEPWVTTIAYGRHRDWTLTEYICQQNNRNSLTNDGKAAINLEH